MLYFRVYTVTDTGDAANPFETTDTVAAVTEASWLCVEATAPRLAPVITKQTSYTDATTISLFWTYPTQPATTAAITLVTPWAHTVLKANTNNAYALGAITASSALNAAITIVDLATTGTAAGVLTTTGGANFFILRVDVSTAIVGPFTAPFQVWGTANLASDGTGDP